MYYDPTWDHGEMRYKCALPKILNYVTPLLFNELKSMKILFHGPKRITKRGIEKFLVFLFTAKSLCMIDSLKTYQTIFNWYIG